MTQYSLGFYKRLADRRKQKGLTQRELAAKLGLTSAAVSRWESGDGMPNEDNLAGLAKALDITVEYLKEGDLTGVEATQPSPLDEADDEYEATINAARAVVARRNGVSIERVRIHVSF